MTFWISSLEPCWPCHAIFLFLLRNHKKVNMYWESLQIDRVVILFWKLYVGTNFVFVIGIRYNQMNFNEKDVFLENELVNPECNVTFILVQICTKRI